MLSKIRLALALCVMLSACRSASSKAPAPIAPNPKPAAISSPEPVCALSEPIVPDSSDLTAADFAGPAEGCPETFEFCATRKAARWVTDLKNNARAIEARCLVTVDGAAEPSP